MKLRTKTIIIVASTLLFLISLLAIFTQNILIKSYYSLENEAVNDKLDLVRDAIKAMRLGLVSKSADWGAWDDAYVYVQNKNKKFEESNFAPMALPNLKIDALAFYDIHRKPIKQIGYNLDEEKSVPFYSELNKYLNKNSDLLSFNNAHEEKSGLLIISEGAFIFVTRPVVDSEMKKPIKGVLFFARRLSPKQVQILAETTHLKIDAIAFNQSQASEDLVSFKNKIIEGKRSEVRIKDDKSIQGYSYISDFFENPAFVFKFESERDIYAVGQASLRNLLIIMSISVFLFGCVLVFFLEKYLVNRLLKMISQIHLIKKNPRIRLQSQGTDEIGLLSHEMNRMLQAIEDHHYEVKSAKDRMTTMLNSLGQGFFLFTKDGVIDKYYSAACEQLLEKSPADCYLWEALNIDKQTCTDWLNLVFSEALCFESLAELGPKEFCHSKGLVISLNYYPVYNDQSELVQVVCIATDITSEMRVKNELEKQKNFVNRTLKIVKNKNEFIQFICDTRELIRNIQSQLELKKLDQNFILRALHTIKGSSAAFSLNEVHYLVHDLESQFVELKNSHYFSYGSQYLDFQFQFSKLQTVFERSLHENKEVLGDSIFDGEKRIEIPWGIVKNYYSDLVAKKEYNYLEQHFKSDFMSQAINKSFGYFDEVAQSLAVRLGKNLKPIQFIGGDIPVLYEAYDELFQSLIHALRNAIDHGIETKDEREQKGKDPSGQIKIEFKMILKDKNEFLKIILSDDGKGIDIKQVKSKAQLNKPEVSFYSNEQVLNLLFESGLSTAEKVSDISGRGIGLDAVKTACLKLNGNCYIQTNVDKGTDLIVEVPLLLSQNFFNSDLISKVSTKVS